MLAVALFALVPYILVVSGAALFRNDVLTDLGATEGALGIIDGLSTAGYAFGALLGGDLINRYRQRRLFIACEGLFIVGWTLAALAGGTISYGAGRILTGFATGLLLVTALPPVIRRFPPSRLPVTAVFINLGFFRAIAAGPLLGGAVAALHLWRGLYGGFAGLGIVTVAIALLTLPHIEPPNAALCLDRSGLALGLVSTVAVFWGSGELTSHGFATIQVALPLGIGLACFVALLLVEYYKAEPLSPVRLMWSTLPVVGILVAMIGGGAFFSFVLLVTQSLLRIAHRQPLDVGLLFWPQIIGALLTAAALGLVFRTRFLPVLAFAGMLLLVAGGALLVARGVTEDGALLLSAVALLGLGAGATVSPGMFMAGFSLQAQIIGRLFALVELVRSVADFILGPVILRIARDASHGAALDPSGVRHALWITLLITLAATVLCLVLYVLGGAGLPRPDIDGWIKKNRTALHSPRLLKILRGP
jgi:MFS family permease